MDDREPSFGQVDKIWQTLERIKSDFGPDSKILRKQSYDPALHDEVTKEETEETEVTEEISRWSDWIVTLARRVFNTVTMK